MRRQIGRSLVDGVRRHKNRTTQFSLTRSANVGAGVKELRRWALLYGIRQPTTRFHREHTAVFWQCAVRRQLIYSLSPRKKIEFIR